MSHTTTLKAVVIRDVNAMHQATAALKAKGINCELVQNAKARMYYSDQHAKSAFVLKLNDGRYDVGFDLQPDGTYAPVFDTWQDYVSQQIGAGKSCPLPSTPEGRAQHAIGGWMQEYSRYATINAAASQGYMVESSSIDADGNIQLTIAV